MPKFFVAALLCATSAHALTVDELLAKHVEARGGAAAIRAIHSLRTTGKVKFGDPDSPTEAEYAQIVARPAMTREETTLQGLTAIEAYDGKDGWAVSPFGGRKDAVRRSADETKALAEDADLEGPLVFAREKGHKVELLGTEDVDGTEAYKLRVTLKDGNVQYSFLDPDSFLEIRVVSERRIRGVESVTETDLGSYVQVAGVWFPMSFESGKKGGPRTSRYTFDRAEANVDAPASFFRMPDSGTSPREIFAAPGTPLATGRAPRGGTAAKVEIDSAVISGLPARNVGSAAMSGRIASIDARNVDGKTLIYIGAASGGIWKSEDGGTTFKPVFDKQKVQSIGAIAIDPNDSRTVWAGSGESWTRNSVSVGDGVYKSTDGGESWTNMGLPESERISRILIDPRNSNVVYACAPGKLWSDSKDRGLYKTVDGGKTWALVLHGNNLSTGCSGVTMDARNPDVLFAGLWDFRRKGWSFRSGGDGPDAPSGSGLWRTADAGRTWTEVKGGLPAKPWGRVEVVIAPSNDKVIYAFVESKDSALYRSADGGATWEKRDKSNAMVWRPFYFARLVVDPKNPDRIFKAGGSLIASEDGGRSFGYSGGQGHGDWHDVWIDPQNPMHVLGADDGGFWLSYDGGSRWWKANNLPISQFYHVAVDEKDPYQVYGGLQDNSSWAAPSSAPGGIANGQWENLAGGDGFWVVPDPTDPDAAYAESQGGFISRIDRKTRATRDIQPKALYKEKLRYNWNTPIAASPTQKGTIYIGAQFLFRSRDRGDSWERISPDLTTDDKEKQKQEESGGITVDNSAAEMHTSIYAIAESPLDANTIWVGTDDGNVQLTRDAGKSWTNLTANLKGLPKSSWVSFIAPSPHDAGTAFATFDRHTFGDMTPWVYRTTDFGKTWTRIVSPAQGVRGYAHVVKQDPVQRSLLYVGTEFGLWVSLDAGKTWAEYKGQGFPGGVAVRDLQIHPREHDLVLATHGRGIWIVDDISPWRALSSELVAKDAAFVQGRPVQQRLQGLGGWVEGDAAFSGESTANGALITYYQRSRHLYGPITLEIFDAQGKLVDTLSPGKRRGLNRVTWTMQLSPPRVPRAAQLAGAASQGPRVMPGTYRVRLTKGGQSVETTLEIGLDRRAPYSLADRKENFDATMRVHALFGEMSAIVDRLQNARAAAEQRRKALPADDALTKKLAALGDQLEELRSKIVATKEGGAITGEERIREHADQLYGALTVWEGRPGKYQLDRIDSLKRELDEVKGALDTLVASSIRPLDPELKKRNLQPIPATPGETASLDRSIEACVVSRGEECAAPEREALRR